MTMPTPPRPITAANLPGDEDPAALPRTYPTARASGVAAKPVPLDTNYTTYLAEGGYPDSSEAAAAFAAGQRAEARSSENRTALHAGAAPPGSITPAPAGATPKLPPLPQPVDDDGRA